MGVFKMPPQIVRLVLLTVAIVGSYLMARTVLTPPSFRQYGWYRGEALVELASRQIVFAGKPACEICHDEEFRKLAKGSHKGLSCEGCHGPSQAHSDDPDDLAVRPKKEPFSTCTRCHEFNVSRPKWHKQIVTRTHYTGDKCTDCHVPHSPTEVP
ncbi:MAG: hypothetical protein ABSC03_02015 [Verrucomicrobiota bacterium]|jgi:hypothetical protein